MALRLRNAVVGGHRHSAAGRGQRLWCSGGSPARWPRSSSPSCSSSSSKAPVELARASWAVAGTGRRCVFRARPGCRLDRGLLHSFLPSVGSSSSFAEAGPTYLSKLRRSCWSDLQRDGISAVVIPEWLERGLRLASPRRSRSWPSALGNSVRPRHSRARARASPLSSSTCSWRS